jgi:hypothetical protein
MPRGFGRLPFLTRRGASADRSPSDTPAVDGAGIDIDDAPVGPPVLLPAMIYRQPLIDATEVTPVWARPRHAAAAETDGPSASMAAQTEREPAETTDEPPATKPARRRKASSSAGEPKAAGAPRSPRKPSGSRRRSQ